MQRYLTDLFSQDELPFAQTDPEFAYLFSNFAFDEAAGSDLDGACRMMAILSALIGSQSVDAYGVMLPAALNLGVTPVQVKEIVYQAAAYLEFGRVYPFLAATNDVLASLGIRLPLEGQACTTPETRLLAGEKA